MLARPVAIAVSVAAGAWLLLAQLPTANEPTGSAPPIRVYVAGEYPPSIGDARPCLIDTANCLELAPEPFAPCLTAELERCNQEWRFELLIGRNAPAPRR